MVNNQIDMINIAPLGFCKARNRNLSIYLLL